MPAWRCWFDSCLRCLTALVLMSAACIRSTSVSADDSKLEGWRMVWNDEFDGESIDRTKWDFDLGNGFYNYEANTWISGWGNGELQYYTREPENAFASDGLLHIRAIRESLHGCGYTSARLKSRNRDGSRLFAQRYGLFEIRAKLPTGQGVWPAFWMLPEKDVYGGWAASGEIDILEVRGQNPREIVGTIHYGSRWPENASSSAAFLLPQDGRVDAFHVYAVEWEPGLIRWSVDGHVYATQDSWWSSSQADGDRGLRPKSESALNPWPAPFDQPFYLLMNVAVGGQFVGAPDHTTAFPAVMQVDYVRVYERIDVYGRILPRNDRTLPFERSQSDP